MEASCVPILIEVDSLVVLGEIGYLDPFLVPNRYDIVLAPVSYLGQNAFILFL